MSKTDVIASARVTLAELMEEGETHIKTNPGNEQLINTYNAKLRDVTQIINTIDPQDAKVMNGAEQIAELSTSMTPEQIHLHLQALSTMDQLLKRRQ